ncbi:TORTIFOLIA1-like protein 3 [Senna tora]|uniref:TORTIFOLIA1-like protein 3 n=1 Tax=Senna tora TaxID=362788 RepID=A0A834X4E3_9FABA|nr:TORTIFOLIA1-like protein 3 [Senna tora]
MADKDQAEKGSKAEVNMYHLHSSDHPGMPLVSTILDGKNYWAWSISIMTALEAKDKIGFVDGSITPPTDPGEFKKWKMADSMVKTWMANSISKEISDMFVFCRSSKALWDVLADRYTSSISQGSDSVTTYFNKINRCWDELSRLTPVPACTCGKCVCDLEKRVADLDELIKLMQFLMGLNPTYDVIRTHILHLTPLPSINKAYAMLLRRLSPNSSATGIRSAASIYYRIQFTMPPPSSSPSQNLKQRVFTCLNKLSDRDTQSLAASELHSIARNLDPNSVSVFLSCIHSADASDKSPVRKQCVQVLEVLSETHGNALSPYLSKILGNIVRRLRDTDSAPLAEALFTEQDQNSQMGAALCLASAVDSVPDPEPARLMKLLPRFEKLLKCEGFKAKPALLTLLGSVIEAGGASSPGALRNLVPCMVEFLGSKDWAARKAAAEALMKLAIVERDMLSEFKAGCLKVFESRRFDKVKVVREVMSQMLEVWKQMPDVSDEFSPPPQSQASSKENASDGRYPPVVQNSCSPGSVMSQFRKKSIPVSRSTPPASSTASNAKKMSPLSNNKRMNSAAMRKLNHKNWDVQITVSNAPSATMVYQGDLEERDGVVLERSKKEKTRFSKPEMKRALFSKTAEDKIHKFGGSKNGSRVVPCPEEVHDSVAVSNVTKEIQRNDKEGDDLSVIRNQLSEIEKQQSSLLDLVQKFIGSSQNGMRSLETRVHGLELALDEISYDLAVSSGRMTTSDAPGVTCCLLPGAEFLSSKFWRKTQDRYSSFRTSRSAATPSLAAMQYRSEWNGNTETSRRFRLHGDRGLITNPLAEIHSNSRETPDIAH